MENNIPTAKQFIKQLESKLLSGTYNKEAALIEFAKMHVKEALFQAEQHGDIRTFMYSENMIK